MSKDTFGSNEALLGPLDYLQEGVKSAAAGQMEFSLECFSRGLALAPTSAGLFLNRSIVHERLAMDTAAFADLDQYLQFAPIDSKQNINALKRFIALGLKLANADAVLIRMQKLELQEQWQSPQFYEVLLGLLSLEPHSLEASLIHYLQRATQLNMLTKPCLENALSVWQLHALSSRPFESVDGLVSARDILMQLSLTPNAPQFILHMLLDDVAQHATNSESRDAQCVDILSLWIQAHPLDRTAAEELVYFLFQKNQFDLVESLFLELSRRFPDDPKYLLGLSSALLFKRDVDRAFVVINAALDLDEKNTEVRLQRALVFQQTLNPSLALVDINQNLQFDPEHLPSLIAKASVLTDLGRLDEALALNEQLILKGLSETDRLVVELNTSFIYRLSAKVDDWYAKVESLALQYPDDDHVLCELGFKKVHEGNWREGFALLEHRFAQGVHYYPVHPHILHLQIPIWSPEIFHNSVKGKHLLLCGEEGLGDMLQFARFIPLLLERGLTITLMCKEALHALLGYNFPQLKLITAKDLIANLYSASPVKYDFYGEIMSIPRVLNLSPEDLSGKPYLKANPKKVAAMAAFKKEKIQGKEQQLAIGLRWLTNLARSGRSVPLVDLAPISKLPIHIFGLHYGPIKDREKALYEQWSNFYPTELEMDDLAGLMMNLDCIVASDTMTAHLAGALGRPTILLKTTFLEWRWTTGDRSNWYDSMRIIHRQNQEQGYAWPIEELVELLQAQAQQEKINS